MKKFRTRLSLIFIVLIGFSVLSSGVFMVQMVEDSYLDALRSSMLREMRIIAGDTEWPLHATIEEKMQYLTEVSARTKSLTGERITFLDANGVVVGDSDHDPHTMDNHLAREEILEAKQEGVGYAIRYSETIGRDMLYAAIPIKLGAEEAPDGYLRLAVSLEEVKATTNRLWAILITGLFAYFLIAGLLSFRIAKGLTKPLERAVEVANRIAKLELNSRVEVTNKDEFGQLAEAINTMADSLQRQMDKIREGENRLKHVLDNLITGVVLIDRSGNILLINRTAEEMLGYSPYELVGKRYDIAMKQHELNRLITACMEQDKIVQDDIMLYYPQERILEANLVPVNELELIPGIVIVLHDITEIRRLERMRSEFVANVSHELRTPITAVRGFAETLLAGAMNDKETAESFLKIIYDESNRLGRLIEDTLSLSKIESKLAPMQFAPIELDSFLEHTLNTVRGEADRRRISLELRSKAGVCLEADEDRLRQIMLNLLSNAINYTPEGGQVTVIAEPVQSENESEYERVRITVQDTGMGIPRKDLPRIFERFYRVDKARSRGSGGTGLGLSIVKHLVELHRGTVQVESTLSVGSTFTVELPVLQG